MGVRGASRFLLWPIVAALLGPAQAWGLGARLHSSPEATVRALYKEVVARQPLGISTYPHFLTVFGPYLSERLVRHIKLDRLCEQDWLRRTHGGYAPAPPGPPGPPGPPEIMKPPFAWLELGLFSGDVEQAEPASFQIKRVVHARGGATYVHVRMAEWGIAKDGGSAPPSKHPPEETWEVAVRVVNEHGRSVVDDVVYLKGKYVDFQSTMSGELVMGCRGGTWVGRLY
jgi:hypothetical protein